LPKQVCIEILALLWKEISTNFHAKAWKYYKVRPRKGEKGNCQAKYCHYDNAHRDYVYTREWVKFLAQKLANKEAYARIASFR
jgi:hypothetical protein